MGMFIACLLGGWFGLHKFIEKKKGLGFFYLLTLGIFGIGWFIDSIVYLRKALKKNPPSVISEIPSHVSDPIVINKANIENHKVVGTSHYLNNIMTLASENMDYDLSLNELCDDYLDGRVYQYDFYFNKTELIPEPDNPHDPNAIKVVIDGVHVGYIKAGSCSHIHNLMKEDRIEKIEGKIEGGKYKYIGYDEDKDKYYMEKDEKPIFVDLKIIKKEVEEF